MALEVILKAEKTDLRMQEDAECTVILRNSGGSDFTLKPPAYNADYPRFQVRRLETGETLIFRRKRIPPKYSRILPTLAPGKEMIWSFFLLELIEFPGPGEYELIAEYDWGEGPAIARSEPLAFKIEGVVPQTMILTVSQEPKADEFYIFWTERSGDTRHLVRSTVTNYGKPEIVASDPVGKFPPTRDFFASNAAPGGNPLNTWLVWIAERRLFFRLVQAEEPRDDDFSIEMPDATIQVVPAPLILDSMQGEVLLWLSGKEAAAAKLQLAMISPSGKGEPGPDLVLPHAAEPLWAHTAFLANGERRAYLVYHEQDSLKVYVTRWKKGAPLESLELIGEAKGALLAAGLSVIGGNRVSGRLLVLPPDRADSVTLFAFGHDADGEPQSGPTQEIEFEDLGRIDRSIVRINDEDEAFIALRPAGKPWHVYEPEEPFVALEGEIGSTTGPFGMFFNRVQEPVLVHVRPGSGFFFTDFTGEPVQTTQRG